MIFLYTGFLLLIFLVVTTRYLIYFVALVRFLNCILCYLFLWYRHEIDISALIFYLDSFKILLILIIHK